MLRRTPTSTLFPYTTLFRSLDQLGQEDMLAREQYLDFLKGRSFRQTLLCHHEVELARRIDPDRKSTRLNSSHEWISYAVFCLKKKTKRRSRTLGETWPLH